ncbi:bifunctional hydroxymethylpyrimidine kinase/phosphomethylpyrimidine kinase [Plantactinospora sp. KBS50]|uniref:bifunctional hydroxymethylpyrimidine kinase/phosphomethylpyrimidine kinase n=1 Tax=Plantactinospora sp. KBS50 TaxID=2024580 RepID=UPI000BAB1BAE|nr:bifunctional hydroxymethylpyrimidine kinase/phosphomethylpyrimidine kinase [Plantactinospora sp. KBS50]ASW53583.1 bifunctional hydroxymethylpyrimidine kinase/phosphomethylpyrimidine kinase [Plantactinospora sp. KBS50]
MTPTTVLTVAGSDSGAGAGIQADLKTFAALGAYGTSVVTAVTAQNTREVTAVHAVPAGVVADQLEAVLSDFRVRAVKTGMLGDEEIAEVLATRARAGRLPNLVVDPVLVATTGARLGAVETVRRLLPYAFVVTPNRAEAEALVGAPVRTPEQMLAAARELAAGGPAAVVVTGGDPAGADPASDRPAGGDRAGGGRAGGAEPAVDALWHAGRATLLRGPRVATRNTHGTGCSFSAALATRLAAGDDVPAAVGFAKQYVARAIGGARSWELGGGHGPLDHFGWSR